MEKLKALIKSRKFWAAVGGIVVVFVKGYDPNFPLSDEQTVALVGVLAAYIVGTGLDHTPTGAGGSKAT